MKTNIYIVRHGQTEWNVLGRMQGHKDSPLTELGVQQATWLGEALQDKPIDIIYSSSSPRARRTAELIRDYSNHQKLDIVETDDFREINLGVWEGMTQDEIERLYSEQLRNFWKNPEKFAVEGSESYQQVYDRVQKKLLEIAREHEGKSILVTTHTVAVKLLMSYFEERPLLQLWELPYIHPACLCQVSLDGDTKEILLHADISHYKEATGEF